MQEALDRRTNHEYTALEISLLTEAQREPLRGHLKCLGCESTAHFRRKTDPSPGRNGRIAHFYCRPHAPNCSLIQRNADPWETNESDATVAQWVERNQTLIVRIQTPVESSEVNSEEGEDADEGSRAGGGSASRTRRSTTISRGPQRLLEQLVHWPSFKTSPVRIRLPDPAQTEVPVHDAFVRFEDARVDLHTERWLGFWGIVRSFSFWPLGSSYYSNFGAENSSFRISIHQSHADAIVQRYRLDSIHDLVGHYLLLFDRARESASGRFTADVNSVHHVGFVRNTDQ